MTIYSNRLMNALQLFPIDASCSSHLRLNELMPIVLLDSSFQSTAFRHDIQRQCEYEMVQQRLRQQLTEKYRYMMGFISTNLVYEYAVQLYHEIGTQMEQYYYKTQIELINELGKDVDELLTFRFIRNDHPEYLLTLTQAEQNVYAMIKMLGNRLYMKRTFVERWMETYPETDQEVLENELELSYQAKSVMLDKSPKGFHLDAMDAMHSAVVDSVEEWFVTIEQYQTDQLERPEVMKSLYERHW